MNDIIYSLPDDLRDKLQEPLGQLVNEEDLLRLLKKEKFIVTVGDQVTYTLLRYNIIPVFCVVDFKIKRDCYSSDIEDVIRSFGRKRIVIQNPPGCLSDELWNAIETAYENMGKGPLRIEIEGEEDLAALPAIFLAPRDVTIIYGLPDKGVVVVKAIEENKRKVKEILDKM